MSEPAPPNLIPRERLEFVESAYLAGRADHLIRKAICDRYGVTLRTARRYLRRVREKLAALPAPDPAAVRARSEAMLLEAYGLARDAVKYVTFQDGVGPMTAKETRAVPAPEVGTMASVAFRLSELHGATGAKRVDVTSGGERIATMTDAELNARIAELERGNQGG